jgi:uncharacterized membrane protein YhhN
MNFNSFTKVFLSLVFLHLASLYVSDNQKLIVFSKLLIVSSLIFWWIYKSTASKNLLNRLYLVGLICCFIGDAFLTYPGFFLSGLLSFLVAQLLYAFVFLKKVLDLNSKVLGFSVGIGSSIGLFLFLIVPRINLIEEELRLPVIVYSLSILFMFAMAIALSISAWSKWRWIGLSAFLFVLSDTLLAWSMFISKFDYNSILIMATYSLAQFGIMRSLDLNVNKDLVES